MKMLFKKKRKKNFQSNLVNINIYTFADFFMDFFLCSVCHHQNVK